jgi:hypothetical protein
MDTRRLVAARAALRRALDMSQSLVHASPGDHDRQTDLANNYSWAADAETLAGADAVAQKDHMAERAICLDLLKQNPIDHATALELVVNHVKVAKFYLKTGRLVDAIAEAEQSTAEAERLVASDRANLEFRAEQGWAFATLARAHLQAQDLRAAEAARKAALGVAESLVRADRTMIEWNGRLLGEARLLGIEIASSSAHDVLACRRALAPAPSEAGRLTELSRQHPLNAALALTTAEADLLDGDYAYWSGRLADAKAAWNRASEALVAVRSEGSIGLDPQALALVHIAARSISEAAPLPAAAPFRHRPFVCGRRFF